MDKQDRFYYLNFRQKKISSIYKNTSNILFFYLEDTFGYYPPDYFFIPEFDFQIKWLLQSCLTQQLSVNTFPFTSKTGDIYQVICQLMVAFPGRPISDNWHQLLGNQWKLEILSSTNQWMENIQTPDYSQLQNRYLRKTKVFEGNRFDLTWHFWLLVWHDGLLFCFICHTTAVTSLKNGGHSLSITAYDPLQ